MSVRIAMGSESAVVEFGSQLRRAREERGLALESVCQATKLPLRHVRALEAGALEDLPGGVFRRGFVRSYLKVLGLEQDSWMRRFEESCRASGVRDPAGTEWVAFAENVKNSRPTSYRRMGRNSLLAGLLLLLLLGAAWLGWRVRTHRRLLAAPVPHSHMNS